MSVMRTNCLLDFVGRFGSSRNVVIFILYFNVSSGRWTKSRKQLVLNIIHRRQNLIHFSISDALHVQVESVQWTFEDIDSSGGELNLLADFLAKKQFDLVINLPMRNGGARRVSSFMTHGYRTRRLAVDYSVPLITDVKCTKMLVLVCRQCRLSCRSCTADPKTEN